MRHWSIILMYYVIHLKTSFCQKLPLESPRHSHTRNVSQNMCSKIESDLLFPHLPGKGYRGPEDKSDLVRRRFINMAGSRLKSDARRDELHDDPNLIQTLMSRAFIDNANLAFHKSDSKDEDSFISVKHVYQGCKYPKLKLDIEKTFHTNQRGKRDLQKERSSNTEDSDDMDDNYDIKGKSKSLDDSETRVHCVRAGANEVVCRHENYSFNFKLPPDLFDKKIMENLVSSVCTIVEEASPNGKGKVEIAVKKRGKFWKRVKENYDERSDLREPKEDGEKVVNKVIRINIPIDFSAIPLGTDEDDKTLSDKSEFLKETKQSENRENSLLSDKAQDQLVKETKLQLTKSEDSHSTSVDKEIDTQALSRVNSLANGVRDEEQEKWLAKRDSLQDPMVFPPSLILFKRSPSKILEQPTVEDRRVYNVTGCSNKPTDF